MASARPLTALALTLRRRPDLTAKVHPLDAQELP